MFFDEPTGDISPKWQLIIRELRNSYGKTILPAEQNGRKALDIGDKTILLVSGRTACDRNAQAL